MIEDWTLMYRLLGIPDDISQPTYYHLLGVDPRQCDADLIDRALANRKKILRENIPGPQFLALISKFEQDILQVAAETLRDPEKCQHYVETLRQRSLQKPVGPQAPTRADLIRQGKSLLIDALDQEGTLPDESRKELHVKLKSIGFTPGDIGLIMDRIPSPRSKPKPVDQDTIESFIDSIHLVIRYAQSDLFLSETSGGKTSMANQPVLTVSDEDKLYALADHMGIGIGLASKIINNEIQAAGLVRGTRDPDALKRQFERWVYALYPEHDIDEPQRQQLLAFAAKNGLSHAVALEVLEDYFGERSVKPMSSMQQSYVGQVDFDMCDKIDAILKEYLQPSDNDLSSRAVNYKMMTTIILVCLLTFMLTVMFHVTNNPVVKNVSKVTETPFEVVDDIPAEPQPLHQFDEHASKIPPKPKIAKETEVLSFSDQMEDAFSTSNLREDLLVDYAMTMSSSLNYLIQLAQRPIQFNQKLENLLLSNQRAEYLFENMPGLSKFSFGDNKFIVGKSLDKLSLDLFSKFPGIRIQAIDQLVHLNQPEATDLLLNRLVASPYPGVKTISRILNSLMLIDDPNMAFKLLDALGRSNHDRVSVQISQTLVRGTGQRLPSNGMLSLQSSRDDKFNIIKWWGMRLKSQQIKWDPSIVDLREENKVPLLWQPDQTSTKLIVVSGVYTDLIWQVLIGTNWDENNNLLVKRPDIPHIQLPEIEELQDYLLNNCRKVNRELQRLIVQSSSAVEGKRVNGAEVKDEYTVGIQSGLQTYLVEMAWMINLQEKFLLQIDSGPSQRAWLISEDVSQKNKLANAPSSMHQLRQLGLYSNRLWERISQKIRQKSEDRTETTSRITSQNPQTLDQTPREIDSRSQEKIQALNFMIQALQFYLDGRSDEALVSFEKLASFKQYVDFYESILLVPFDELQRQCETAAISSLCPYCGDTLLNSCPRCSGSGFEPCPNCADHDVKLCKQCQGHGMVQCGIAKYHDIDNKILGSQARQSIQKVIDLASHLRDGGIDFYTPDALAASDTLVQVLDL